MVENRAQQQLRAICARAVGPQANALYDILFDVFGRQPDGITLFISICRQELARDAEQERHRGACDQLEQQVRDTFGHAEAAHFTAAHRDEVIRLLDVIRILDCSKCHGFGHTKRGCPLVYEMQCESNRNGNSTVAWAAFRAARANISAAEEQDALQAVRAQARTSRAQLRVQQAERRNLNG